MRLIVENRKVVENPTPAQIERGLRKLRGGSSTEFAILEADDGSFVQAAGSAGGCMLEWHDARSDRHYRGCQEPPVVPFEDGTVLTFSGSEVALRSGEWFKLGQVVEAFVEFSTSNKLPAYIKWTDITDILRAGTAV